MKSLVAAMLWGLAVFVAVGIVYRLWRGKPVVLRGKWSPRVVRMVAILLVTLGYSPDRPQTRLQAAPVDTTKSQPGEELPRTITLTTLTHWHQRQSRADPWMTFKQNFTLLTLQSVKARDPGGPESQREINALPPVLRSHFQAELAAIAKQQPVKYRGDQLLAVLDAAETSGYYDHWLNAHIWRKTADLDSKERPAVFARLHRNARVADALIRSFAEVKPTLNISPRAWMSKAGPSQAERQQMQLYQNQLKEILSMTGKLFAVLDEGTWKRDAVTRFRIAKDSALAELHRGPRRQAYNPGEEFRFGRLDALVTPSGDKRVTLEHLWLGPIVLPAGRIVATWDLPELLTVEQKKKLDEAVATAMQGNEDAADRIETALPLAHTALRIGLKETPDARYAPRMRLILALFDDTVMPAVAEPRNSTEELRGFER